ncbi:MAG: replication-associated recombination protein A [Proteobacteria bacterium]|nr:replication-associated recombination protein A [Desulfobacula sp.]MBU3951196.1 replication-associated recombination protein A [Pseudomonadota bacterium]MBU4131986.1 replication-associated recombination protein A [Pseudomonadota bacterium]
MDLFEENAQRELGRFAPLADRMRPDSLGDLIGQEHITARGSLLHAAIENDRVFSMILWGPPGCGKTTLANIIARVTKSEFIRISAVLSGVKDIREIIDRAKEKRNLYKRRTILFVDEIHRFNKAQQDAFLFHVENGLITLVGATTENPSFEVNPALVSRCRIFTLKTLDPGHILQILKRGLTDPKKGLGMDPEQFSPEALVHIAQFSDGDARIALTNLETAALHFGAEKCISVEDIEAAIEKKSLLYDKTGDEHYNLISAFIKSLRGSDPDAAIYWLERMLAAGDDPYYMLRRMIRFATEDIGLADPGALTMALNAGESFRILGRPEGDGSLFQAAVYLATAPKSNAVYAAHKAVKQLVLDTGYQPVPLHIRNAPTRLMKEMSYGKGYKYAHDYKDGYAPQSYLPSAMEAARFYFPTQRGYEKIVKQRLEAWLDLKKTDPEK